MRFARSPQQEFLFLPPKDRPWPVECYSDIEYATGEINLPFFEDAHSIQAVIRQVVQMVLQKRIERKTASLLLYALQIASSNLKRMELEKPQPEQVVTDLEPVVDPREHGKLPSPAPARPRAKLQPARPQQIAIKKLARSTPRRRRPSARHHPGLLSPRTTNPESPSPKSPATEAICNLNPRVLGYPFDSKVAAAAGGCRALL